MRELLAGPLPRGWFTIEAVDPPFCRPVPMDRSRLAVALANLERVEVLGLQEDHAGWAARLARRAGWPTPSGRRLNAGPGGEPASPGLRRRIAADNALDVELYERARELVAAGA